MSSIICAFCAFCGLALQLEDEPPANLNTAWLEDVGIAGRDAEIYVVNVDVWQSKAPTIEKVEEFSTYLEVSRFSNFCLLHEAEILGEEWLSPQTTIRRRGIAEEPLRIGIVSDVCGIHCCTAIERERRRVAEIERT